MPFGVGKLIPKGFEKGAYQLAFDVHIQDNPEKEIIFQPGVYRQLFYFYFFFFFYFILFFFLKFLIK
jgi:hypothetical protein